MAPANDTKSELTHLQRRAARSGLINFEGKQPHQMSDADCRDYFRYMADSGRHYMFWD